MDFNLSVRLNIDDIEELAIKESQVYAVPMMVLIVRKPDYLGVSQWELRHGKILYLQKWKTKNGFLVSKQEV